jgi:hypothetical protein
MSTNVILVCCYSCLLLAVAYGFDTMARRVSLRARRWRTGAFHYHPDHDAWTCPEDQWLWPTSYDPEQRIVRYRAKPAVCNACPVKHSCTTAPCATRHHCSGSGDPATRECRTQQCRHLPPAFHLDQDCGIPRQQHAAKDRKSQPGAVALSRQCRGLNRPDNPPNPNSSSHTSVLTTDVRSWR